MLDAGSTNSSPGPTLSISQQQHRFPGKESIHLIGQEKHLSGPCRCKVPTWIQFFLRWEGIVDYRIQFKTTVVIAFYMPMFNP
jgi:hypothetical protein